MSDNKKNPKEDMDGDMVEDTVGEDVSNADLLSLMKTYMNYKIAGVEKNLNDSTHSLAKKAHSGGNSGGNGLQLQPFRAGASAGGALGQQSPAQPSDFCYTWTYDLLWSLDQEYCSHWTTQFRSLDRLSRLGIYKIPVAIAVSLRPHFVAGVKNPCDSDFVRSILDASKNRFRKRLQ
ncbi:Hypothetical predicted protein [Mytilus galloprovincialis]|uniref:Uncharacterized protein n=1 Tax=Mytilus galloprovincialis TaxID=29158 RepID=A0A8B6EAN3_MYTGA|nr:Hypothetical predicted protein [Mytilus galloprovincialis]